MSARRAHSKNQLVAGMLGLGVVLWLSAAGAAPAPSTGDRSSGPAQTKQRNRSEPKQNQSAKRQAKARKSQRDGNALSDLVRGPDDVEARLQRRLAVQFLETPLEDCLNWISEELKLDILIDRAALAEEGVTADTPVTLEIRYTRLTVATILDLILKPLGLSYLIDDGFLRVTTAVECEEAEQLRVYDCSDLIGFATMLPPASLGPCAPAHRKVQPKSKAEKKPAPAEAVRRSRGGDPASTLVRIVQNTTSGPWLDFDGVGGSVLVYDGLLIVWQNQKCQREIAELLEQIREAKCARRKGE
ncbi:MAG: hypothetical protein GXP27_04370 [Planctomycetes bacterium]|nr:hypothetical protein [Planctomycetota bacterium]